LFCSPDQRIAKLIGLAEKVMHFCSIGSIENSGQYYLTKYTTVSFGGWQLFEKFATHLSQKATTAAQIIEAFSLLLLNKMDRRLENQ
jgi:hypothetical protein